MVYASFEYYRDKYFGSVIQDQEDFKKFSTRASHFLDYYTRNKAKDFPDLEELQLACCAIAEKFAVLDVANVRASASGGEIQSETVGSHSVTYKTGAELSASVRSEMAAIAKQYLAHTGLLYRGGGANVCTAHCNAL